MFQDSKKVEQALSSVSNLMLSMEQINQLFSAYGEYIGVSDLMLKDEGVAQLLVDGELRVDFIYQSTYPGLLMAVAIQCPDLDPRSVLQRLLQANLDWTLTQGGSFGRIPGTEQLAILQRLSFHDNDMARIDGDVARFVALAQHWHAELSLWEDSDLVGSEPEIGPVPKSADTDVNAGFAPGFIRI